MRNTLAAHGCETHTHVLKKHQSASYNSSLSQINLTIVTFYLVPIQHTNPPPLGLFAKNKQIQLYVSVRLQQYFKPAGMFIYII